MWQSLSKSGVVTSCRFGQVNDAIIWLPLWTCTKRVVGSVGAAKANADLVNLTLEHALSERGYPSGLMFHSDQGSQ